MGDVERAAERLHQLLLPVHDHVEREVGARRGRDRPHVVVHRVAVEHAPACLGVADARRVVQRQHRLEPREARGDHLRATRETGEEVWLDEPRRDPDVGLEPLAVEPDGHVGAETADPHE